MEAFDEALRTAFGGLPAIDYGVVKWLHILSSTLLFGTGIGSAYYMFFVSLTRDAHAVADRKSVV